MAIHVKEVIDYLVIAQDVANNQHYESVSDFLSFSEGDEQINLHYYLGDELVFTEELTYTLSTHKFITQLLEFSQSAVRSKEGWVYQNLTIAQSTVAGGKQWQRPDQTLSLEQSVVHVSPKSAFDTLDITQTVTLHYTLPKSLSQTLTFTDYATVYVESERFIAIATPVVNKQQTTQFSCSGVGSIILPAPEFGDTESIGETRIQRQTRGGDFIIWRDPQWPTTQEFDMTFKYLTPRKVLQLQDFAVKTCGKLVVFRDHHNFTYNVIIVTPEVQVSTTNYPSATIKVLVVKDEDLDA